MGSFLSIHPNNYQPSQCENQLEDSNHPIASDHRHDKVHQKPVFEYSCIFQSHNEFVTWLTSFKNQGIICSVAKSNTRNEDSIGKFPYSRIQYYCQCCKNKAGMIIKYNYDTKQQHVLVEYTLGTYNILIILYTFLKTDYV